MATFGTFVAGQVLTAAELNAAGTWNDYTPTWTQSATITKTVDWARYTQFNKLVIASIKMTATSAGTADNRILVGLPVSASANNFTMGTGWVIDDYPTTDASSARNPVFESATTVSFSLPSASTFNPALRWGQTGAGSVAETIASGDIIYVQLIYEAA
jgi:hypothetical protein